MSTLEMRSMLSRLSTMIRDYEFDAMKFICRDIIPTARLEEMTLPIHLWSALEERDKLSNDNLTFLYELLSGATSNRQDVLKLVEDFQQAHKFNIDETEDLSKEFNLIVENLGREWRPLARQLGLTETDIEAITEDYNRNMREQIRNCLIQWQKQYKMEATKYKLITALKNCELNMLAHQLSN